MNRLLRIPTLLLGLLIVTGLAFAAPAAAHGAGNHGTIKVHDEADVDPDQRNQPHVACDFYVEGFAMSDATGEIVFYGIPPTSEGKTEVLRATWTANLTNEHGDSYFVAGPFRLEAGHYRVEVFVEAGHPGNEGHFSKSKVFWVEECEETEIPFFPSAIAGAAAMAGCVGAYVYMRKRNE